MISFESVHRHCSGFPGVFRISSAFRGEVRDTLSIRSVTRTLPDEASLLRAVSGVVLWTRLRCRR